MKRDCVCVCVCLCVCGGARERGRWRCYVLRDRCVFVGWASSVSWHPDNIRAHLRRASASCQAADKIINIRLLVCWSCVSVHGSIPICFGCACVCVCVCVKWSDFHRDTEAKICSNLFPSIFKRRRIYLSFCLRTIGSPNKFLTSNTTAEQRESERAMRARTRGTGSELSFGGWKVPCPRSSSQTQTNKHTRVLMERQKKKKSALWHWSEDEWGADDRWMNWNWKMKKKKKKKKNCKCSVTPESRTAEFIWKHDTVKNTWYSSHTGQRNSRSNDGIVFHLCDMFLWYIRSQQPQRTSKPAFLPASLAVLMIDNLFNSRVFLKALMLVGEDDIQSESSRYFTLSLCLK